MPVIGSQVSVGAVNPALLADGTNATAQSPASFVVTNESAVTVYLGGVGVTSAGYRLLAGASVDADLWGGDLLYGLSASGTVLVDVLRTRG